MIVTQEDVRRIYRHRFSPADNRAKARIWKVLVESFFQRWVHRAHTVVDLGCGYGEFLNHLQCHRRIGVDLNPDSPLHLDPGVEFHQHSVCELPFLADDSVDLVFTSNLMEHLPGKREVEQMVREAFRVLRPGGCFVMLGPNIRFLPGLYWDFWDHVVPISDRSLVECLENQRFQIAECFPRFLPYSTRSAPPQFPPLVRLYLHLPQVWPILGKQFLIRARKPLPAPAEPNAASPSCPPTPPAGAVPAHPPTAASAPRNLISVVLPVYNEAENIAPCLRQLEAALADQPHEILVCYDFDADSTLPAIAAMPDRPAAVRLIKNDLGRGVAKALQAGFHAARGDVVVSSMADLSDPPEIIPAMAAKIRAGSAICSASRYMKGGSQTGGPPLKRLLSRLAGLSLWHLAGLNTHDATTNFRAYSAQFLRAHPVQSTAGFEVALELTTKAHLESAGLDEVPSSWHDRTAGQSRFDMRKWLPKYLYWYGRAMAAPTLVWASLATLFLAWVLAIRQFGANWPIFDELSYLAYTTGEKPLTLAMLWTDHNGHRLLLPKLIYFGLMKLTDAQPLFIMYFDAALLTVAAAAVLLALRRVRGKMVWTDAVIPVTILAFSQYENMLWAFQLGFILSQVLTLLALAALLYATDRGRRRSIVALGLVTALLPLCGGQGMSMAPAFIAWLLGFGLLRCLRPDPLPRGMGRGPGPLALLCGLLAGAAWVLSIQGLPPGPGSIPLHEALHSWPGFTSLLKTITRTTGEFLSSAFLPAATDPALPAFYHWRTWAVVGKTLFLASLLLLAWQWLRQPGQRRRITALATCLAAFGLLILILGINRGVYGPGAGAVPRYATLALPLLVFSAITFSLYAPRGWRTILPAAIGLAVLALIPGPHGTAQALAHAGAIQRDAYHAFKTDLARPDVTFEELAGHYSTILFAPGEARQVPGFLEMMDRHALGPFRNLHRPPQHVAAWTATTLPIRVIEPQNRLTWPTPTRANIADGSAYFTLDLGPPQPVAAIRLTFTLKSLNAQSQIMQLWWYQHDVNTPDSTRRAVRWIFPPSSPTAYTCTAYIYNTIDRLYIMPASGPGELELQKVEVLQPAQNAASASTH